MRLIDTSTLELKTFTSHPPPYAILSHTWGAEDDEVTLQELTTQPRSERIKCKSGYAKIEKTCEITRREWNLPYAWVDTCCIDKTSSAELSEAINSMYKWYRQAVVCLAFLSDLTPERPSFAQSRWFTRGWTLQELIAPREVYFFDHEWTHRGSRSDFAQAIHDISRIPTSVLTDAATSLDEVPVAARMSWAASRETTREEDLAYCLLGIFDINMPMLYGEGDRAFFRLQEEIMKQSPDMSIFAWTDLTPERPFSGLLATTPSQFLSCGSLLPDTYRTSDDCEFSLTNRGIRFQSKLGLESTTGLCILPIKHFDKASDTHPLFDATGVYLRRAGDELFVRALPQKLATFHTGWKDTFSFRIPKTMSTTQMQAMRSRKLHITPHVTNNIGFPLHKVVPSGHYDPSTDFIHAGLSGTFSAYIQFRRNSGNGPRILSLLLIFNGQYWKCKFVGPGELPDRTFSVVSHAARLHVDSSSWLAVDAIFDAQTPSFISYRLSQRDAITYLTLRESSEEGDWECPDLFGRKELTILEARKF